MVKFWLQIFMAIQHSKEIARVAKLQFVAGQARPGPALAGLGISMPEFTRQFNDQTRERGSEVVPVKIFVYKDKSFTFRLYKTPVTHKILQTLNIEKGAKDSKNQVVATLTQAQLREIAEYKMEDLNTTDIKSAMHIVAGSAKNMGIKVADWDAECRERVQKRLVRRKELEEELLNEKNR